MNLVQRLAGYANPNPAAVTPDSDIRYLVPYEPDAYGHWIFNKGDSRGLIDLVAGRALTPQAAAPTYSSNYLSVPALLGNALLTDRAETANMTDTVCALIRIGVGTNLQPVIGSMGAGASTGGSLFFSGTEPSRSLFSTFRGVTNSVVVAATGSPSAKWLFVAFARDFSGTTKVIRQLVGGSALVESSSAGPYVPATAGQFVALGNPYYTTTAGPAVDAAEFIYFSSALSANRLAGEIGRAHV